MGDSPCSCGVCSIDCQHDIFAKPSDLLDENITREVESGSYLKHKFSNQTNLLNPCLRELLDRVYEWNRSLDEFAACPECRTKRLACRLAN